MSILSVDLGTSNTVAVLAAHGRLRVVEVDGSSVLPSAVFAAEDGRLVVGREAERRARLDPARFEPNPKRRVDEGTLLLGDRVVPVSEAFAAVLGKVGGEVSRQLGGARPDEVRLTHPAQWGPVRRNVLLSAARQVGLGARLVLVPEPVAAAAHFASFPGRALAPGQGLAVYDLGAGTFDVAVVSGSVVLAESGLPDLGGLDVDQALLSHVGRQVSGRDPGGWQRLLLPTSTADRRAQRVLREDVRAAKESLSSHPQTEVPLPEPFGDVLVTRAELEGLIRPNLLRSVELLDATVRSAGLSRDRLAGVYLVGGSSRIPLVATLIAEQLRIVPTNLDQPETAVALGAHHVSPEGTSLRTENLPDAVPAVVAADERTTHMAPPPRPAPPFSRPAPGPDGHPRPAPARPVPLAGPMLAPGPTLPPPTPPQRRSALPWLIGVAVLVVAVLGTLIMVAINDRDVAHPKNVAVGADCSTILSVEAASEAFGKPAKFTDAEGLCTYYVDQIGIRDATVAIQDHGIGGATEIDFEGNPAFERREEDQCMLSVQVRDDDVEAYLFVWVTEVNTADVCTLAEKIAKIAFDNLPNA